jgi:hypothetical protein
MRAPTPWQSTKGRQVGLVGFFLRLPVPVPQVQVRHGAGKSPAQDESPLKRAALVEMCNHGKSLAGPTTGAESMRLGAFDLYTT